MQEIAEKIGISPVNLSASLNGNPTLNRLQEVADILEVDIADFFSRENTEDIHGFLEYKGKVYRINGMGDFKAVNELINK